MNSYFLNDLHKDRFIDMQIEDSMSYTDFERASLFYILSGNEDLYKKRRFLYNPSEHTIHPYFKDDDVDFSSGILSLIRLGFNLYNGWSDNYTTPLYVLMGLDEQNLLLAENAMRIRFNTTFFKNLLEE
jgi:hypothetical protein